MKKKIIKEGVIPFNSLVRHRITGFEGYVICRVEHVWECIRYEVQPKLKENGHLPDCVTLGAPGLETIAPPQDDLTPVTEIPNVFDFNVKVRHRLTGFTGVVVARIKFPYNGNRYVVQPAFLDENGNIPEFKTFDEEELEQIDPPPKQMEEKKKTEKPNGPNDRHDSPSRRRHCVKITN